MKILIGVDDSSESRDAVDTAFEVFGPASSYIIAAVGDRGSPSDGLVFSAGYTGGGFGTALELNETFQAAELEAARQVAEAAQQRLPAEAEDVTIEVDLGHVGVQLCEMAEGCDFVVIGSHDKNVWHRLFDPSVGRYLVDHAPCPVLVVR